MISIMIICFSSPSHVWIKLWIFAPSYDGLIQGINVTATVSVFHLSDMYRNIFFPGAS